MKKIKWILLLFVVVATQKLKAQDTAMQKMMNAYFEVKNALISSNNFAAQNNAKIMVQAIKNISTLSLDEKRQKEWSKIAKRIKNDGQAIANTSDIKIQRAQFNSLSITFYRFLKDFKTNTDNVYYQYCPMKDKYWLSKEKTISNPYYGAEMPTCGVTKATLERQ